MNCDLYAIDGGYQAVERAKVSDGLLDTCHCQVRTWKGARRPFGATTAVGLDAVHSVQTHYGTNKVTKRAAGGGW